MITKKIEFQGFNKVEILKIYEDSSVLTNLIEEVVTEATENTETQITEVRRENNISFDPYKWPFTISEEEILELNPIVTEPLIEE